MSVMKNGAKVIIILEMQIFVSIYEYIFGVVTRLIQILVHCCATTTTKTTQLLYKKSFRIAKVDIYKKISTFAQFLK
jgi:hypothetical protein